MPLGLHGYFYQEEYLFKTIHVAMKEKYKYSCQVDKGDLTKVIFRQFKQASLQ